MSGAPRINFDRWFAGCGFPFSQQGGEGLRPSGLVSLHKGYGDAKTGIIVAPSSIPVTAFAPRKFVLGS